MAERILKHDLVASKFININATAAQVWEAITNPAIIKQYLLFDMETDWKVGSPIIFHQEYDAWHKWDDKGIVVDFVPNKLCSYLYWSTFTGLEDIAENYSLMTQQIDVVNDNVTTLTWSQKGFLDEKDRLRTNNGLLEVMQQVKTLVEAAAGFQLGETGYSL